MVLNVIIATRNRSANLRDLLEGLLRCEVSLAYKWDVWVIDNNSTDDTPQIVQFLASQHPNRIHYRSEPAQGKSFALNRGIRESSGDIVIFTDDDCIPDVHWIENIGREFSTRPDLGIVGGRIELYNPLDKPLTIRTWTDRRILTSASDLFFFIAGCNMAVRRDVLTSVGDFDTRLGPGSPKDTVAEDPDFIYRALRMGTKIEYVPEVLVHHNHGRKSESDAKILNRKYMRGRGAFYAKHILKGDSTILKLAYWEFRSIAVSFFRNLVSRKPVSEEWFALRCLMAGMTSRLTG